MSKLPAGGASNEYLSGLDLQEIYGEEQEEHLPKIPKICGRCQHYIFWIRGEIGEGKDKKYVDKHTNECDEGIPIIGNMALHEGCKQFTPCAVCRRCGILIGPHHLNTAPVSLGPPDVVICGMCHRDSIEKARREW